MPFINNVVKINLNLNELHITKTCNIGIHDWNVFRSVKHYCSQSFYAQCCANQFEIKCLALHSDLQVLECLPRCSEVWKLIVLNRLCVHVTQCELHKASSVFLLILSVNLMCVWYTRWWFVVIHCWNVRLDEKTLFYFYVNWLNFMFQLINFCMHSNIDLVFRVLHSFALFSLE